MAGDGEAPALPKTMQAWTYSHRGNPTAVLSLADVPLPELFSPNDVLVKVSYTSLNPAGALLIAIVPAFARKSPSIPELDFSGTVVKVGAAVRADIKPGVPVFGSVPPAHTALKRSGALAEYVVVPATNVAIKPDTVSFEAASGLGITGVTAIYLAQDANLKEGDKVLINGASGGVGTMAVQIARKTVGESGKVIAICSGENAKLVSDLGANEVIDRKEHDPVHEYLARTYSEDPFDAIIDAVGIQELFDHSPKYLSARGPFVSVGVMSNDFNFSTILRSLSKMAANLYLPRILGGVPRTYKQRTAVVDSPRLEELRELSGSGKLKVIADSTFQMKDALKAYEKILTHKARGKISISVDGT